MLYKSSLLLISAQTPSFLSTFYATCINQALHITIAKGGTLDILVMSPLKNVYVLEKVIGELYDISRREAEATNRTEVNVRVLIDRNESRERRNNNWDVIAVGQYEYLLVQDFREGQAANSSSCHLPSVILKMAEDPQVYLLNGAIEEEEEHDVDEQISKSMAQLRLESASMGQHTIMAIGGTFDHLHDGHKILISVGGYLSNERLVIGVTGPELLKNKKYAEYLQDFDERVKKVRDFAHFLFPDLVLQIEIINDVYGPTATDPNIEGLVVSKETKEGAKAINEYRIQHNMNELVVYEIMIIGCVSGSAQDNWSDKLSSTQLRKKELELLGKSQKS
ncbi:hypothetical protein NADFUDRAFT_48790 [Nadsonia fulvescens var. elongata DSM 6958]|uniref:Cytidyltransferase-like domain-containing protein n=1 Tax=Nadsonia fulvescens var. elongata DSM 6958 TaxID=857566 RepID=A0A1E3PRU6_9ASCO|nr:hypothetical protein NADFUDRAFT_48790 [Nadsonia fulvescens var. elongata DSM 6958]